MYQWIMQLSHNTGLVVDGATVLVAVDHDGNSPFATSSSFLMQDNFQIPWR
jgi:hypothetical protein